MPCLHAGLNGSLDHNMTQVHRAVGLLSPLRETSTYLYIFNIHDHFLAHLVLSKCSASPYRARGDLQGSSID